MADPNVARRPMPKLSDRLKLIDCLPGVAVPISEDERRYMLKAVEEKEERDARQEQETGGQNGRAGWGRHLMDRRS